MQPWNAEVSVNKLFPLDSEGNISCDINAQYIYESDGVKFSRISTESLLALLGIIGNLFVCLLQAEHLRINRRVIGLIRSLALADLGILLVCFPFAVAKEQEAINEWTFGAAGCKVFYPFCEAFYAVSIWSVVAISIERYRIFKRNNNIWAPSRENWQNWRIVTTIWIIAFFVYSLPLFFSSTLQTLCGKKMCYLEWSATGSMNSLAAKLHSFTLLFTLYFVPVCIIAWTYFRASRRKELFANRHKRARRRIRTQFNSLSSALLEEEEAVREQLDSISRIHLPVVGIFAITMVPVTLLRFIFSFFPNTLTLEKYLVLFNISIVFIILHAAAKPCVYFLLSRSFRSAYAHVWKRLRAYARCRIKKEERLVSSHDFGVEIVSLTSTTTTLSRYKETTL
ncbi:neuropeptide Y receptor type 1 [Nematostella vectensis]|uniref:neuropeptide Y receptor type 1 n=1 Tax=Nematostella vectensis TaxID=45351 RepID=UPI00207758A8|nr:neuropeptide Y receptor type 1 [Nematostella vectensis]